MADESFREIQLSGKQLIALFMAAAVVLIVTFLSGVLVGRGVRSQQEPAASVESVQTAGGAVDPDGNGPEAGGRAREAGAAGHAAAPAGRGPDALRSRADPASPGPG